MNEFATLSIEFRLPKGQHSQFTISGDIKPEAYEEIISSFLQTQIGSGVDKREAIERDAYHITLRWYPEDDRIEAISDTGNLGLRDGILIFVLSKLPDYQEKLKPQ